MSCAPNIMSLRLDENIVRLERTIYVAWLHKGCFTNGMFKLYIKNTLVLLILYTCMYIATCDIYQRINHKMTTGAPELHPIPVKSPW